MKPMFFIDIAVPRDIDPKVNDVENVYLYDIDDLQGVVAANLEQRSKEAEKAEADHRPGDRPVFQVALLPGGDADHRRPARPNSRRSARPSWPRPWPPGRISRRTARSGWRP